MLKNLVEDLKNTDSWEDKYRKIIDLGKTLENLDESEKTEENLVQGCQSRVWLVLEKDSEKNTFKPRLDSDALIVKGLLKIVQSLFSDKTAEEILNTDLSFLKEIGLEDHLTMTRLNGLLAVIKTIKLETLLFEKTKNKNK
jgi:cysteine desulfuration protein SufE